VACNHGGRSAQRLRGSRSGGASCGSARYGFLGGEPGTDGIHEAVRVSMESPTTVHSWTGLSGNGQYNSSEIYRVASIAILCAGCALESGVHLDIAGDVSLR
jgi:hypothetical protein